MCFSFIPDNRVQKRTFLWQRWYTTSCTFSTAFTFHNFLHFASDLNQVLVDSALVVHQKRKSLETNIRNTKIVWHLQMQNLGTRCWYCPRHFVGMFFFFLHVCLNHRKSLASESNPWSCFKTLLPQV